MPSQNQYVDSKFLFPHTYREGNKCIGWSKSNRRLCNNPISQGKHLRHLLLMEQLNELSIAEQISSPLLEQAVELRLCHIHLKNYLGPELEKAQRKLMVAMDDSERQGAAQAFNDYISPACTPAIRHQQIRVAEARIPPTGPLPPHPAVRFWEPTHVYGNQLGGQSHPWARGVPLTPPTSLPSPRDNTPDSDVTIGRSMNSTSATIYIPSDSGDGSTSDDDDDDSSEDEGPVGSNSRVYQMRFWDRYDKKWDSLEDNGRIRGKALEEQIPWPVYGKSYPTPENVEAFYHDAFIGFATRSDRILVMGNECRRWAPKNLKKVLGKRIFKGMFAETLQMIYSVARSCHDRLISEPGGN
ncbi:hypothetical protein LCI18_000812 [Fusarium solani-melongenae]|uniref:Uncharacterized protein n=1 Tax=Fusarium solani subsp. cucurbitae TaxID=2747967 RepID=A0ACD3YLL5_FUSSC|nr:hypothetical protein LCI18_000812 [Fusarium solani-melongenae]